MENDSVKFISLDPSKKSIEPLAKCFNYRGCLPQVVVDKIVDSYDKSNSRFDDVNLSLNDFYDGYEIKPLVSTGEVCNVFERLGKMY